MTDYVFDVDAFRASYKAFESTTLYPDETLEMNYVTATYYISDCNYGRLRDDARYRALTLMTAHLTALLMLAQKGKTPGQVQSGTVDKVSVSYTPPANKSEFHWWLNQTAYGQQLLALLSVNSAGGFYIGGSPFAYPYVVLPSCG